MLRNISEVLKSSADVLEQWSRNNNSNWRSLDMQKVHTSDGRCVYQLDVKEGFFSYLKNHVKCFLFASHYKKTMEEALQTPSIEKSIKDRYVAALNTGAVPFVRHISYKAPLPAVEVGQNTNSQTLPPAGSDHDSGSETASNPGEFPEPFEGAPGFGNDPRDIGYAQSPVSHNHSNADPHDYGLQQALVRSMKTQLTDQSRRDATEAARLAKAISDSMAVSNENDPTLIEAIVRSRLTEQQDEQRRLWHLAREQADVQKAIGLSLSPDTVTESDPGMAQGIAASKQTGVSHDEKCRRQEEKAKEILKKYHRNFFQTTRQGDCFYDGICKLRGHSSITDLRKRSYEEGIKCLQGEGKLKPFDPEVTPVLKDDIEKLRNNHNYALETDVRLMACTENCRIVVCDLEEAVRMVAGPEGELDYPKKTLSEVMEQYPEAELFVLDNKHYMTGKKN
ncbi:hypothetical protein [Endozoicomonas sp. ONNA2]|uniref:hypothetical protein n=1 Tax=Endozoicomonas sp. ONNA2 TaxID=2828741 RepID=UPI0021473877|nr:hypothetical protein [Endozoicomonas sp. ONNA2]